MKIQSITCENFRGLNDVALILDGKSAVLFGANGTGKSSALWGINLMFARIINKVVNRPGLRQNFFIKIEDIQYGKSSAAISVKIAYDDTTDVCKCGIVRKSGAKYYSHTIKEIASYLQGRCDESREQGLPVFVNYGTNRLVLEVPLRIKMHHEFDLYSAYEQVIENKIDFRTFFEWFRNQEDYEHQCAIEKGNLEYKDTALEAVRRSMLSMLEGCTNVRVSRKPRLEMKVDKGGISLNITQLSDGEKCTLAMFGDLARRMTLANPYAEDPLLGEGIVLIDEIELHMHPSWQRNVLRALRETFPNVQFIVTTHSPIVLSEIGEDYKIFYMEKQGEYSTAVPMNRMDGYTADAILEQFMGTPAINSVTEKLIHTMYKSIQEKNWDAAEKYIRELVKLTDENHPDVLSAQMEIMRRRTK